MRPTAGRGVLDVGSVDVRVVLKNAIANANAAMGRSIPADWASQDEDSDGNAMPG